MGEDGDLSLSEAMKKKEDSIPRSFKKLMKENGIKEKTLDVLVENDVDSVGAISTLSHADIESLGLTLGQRNLLKKCVDTVNSSNTGSEDSDNKPSAGSAGSSAGSVKSVKASLDSATNPTSDKQHGESLPNVPVTAKPIHPVPRPLQFIEGKKTYGELSLSELMYASLLILENMLSTADPNATAYTRHLAFLALKSSQNFTTESILTYDNAVRSTVESSGNWSRDSDVHLANCHLVRAFRPSTKPKDRKPKYTGDNPLNNKCIRYNAGNCDSGDRCRYDHKCMTCSGYHPMTACKTPHPKPAKSQ